MQQPKRNTKLEAHGRWRDILLQLGLDAQFLQNRHTACPICGGKDRYRYHDRRGEGDWHCNQCGPGDGFNMLQRLYRWSWKEAADEIDRVIGTARLSVVRDERTEEENVEKIKRVLNECQFVVEGDPVWRYLNRRTGIVTVPRDLRYHPGLWNSDVNRELPAMVALMRYANGKGSSVHRTYLTPDGDKAPVEKVKKIMSGKPLNTSCVRLSDPAPILGIAEGIETALAASVRFGVPVWAATTAGLMEKWEPPAGTTEVLICADNDRSYTGQSAAFLLARRLTAKGITVRVEIPSEVGTDFADMEMESA